MRIWNVTTGTSTTAHLKTDSLDSALAWSDDGRILLVAGARWGVRRWDQARDETTVIHPEGKPGSLVVWSPDGGRYTTREADRILLWDHGTREPTADLDVCGVVGALAFSADAGRFAAAVEVGNGSADADTDDHGVERGHRAAGRRGAPG